MIRYLKLYLYLAASLSGLSVIAQGVPALAETSQLGTISSKRVVSSDCLTTMTAGPKLALEPSLKIVSHRLDTQGVVTTEAVYAATSSTTPTIQISTIAAPKAISATTTRMVQAAPVTTGQNQTALTAASKDQVTSVDQLSDVKPTDWAFQALQSLIERYGVIADYQKGTYRGNQTMTRYEFAASLNVTLNRVNELIASGMEDLVSREDLATLQRLREEFAAELAPLHGRVDNLEARTATLAANQFSTTTKLLGQLVLAVTEGGFSGKRIVDPRGVEITNKQPNPTIYYRYSLDLNTSFSGTDLLKVRIQAGSDRGTDNAAGFLEPTFGSVPEFTQRSAIDDKFAMVRLNYTFTPLKDFKVTLGPVILAADYVDKNSYANLSFLNFSTLALVNNYILFPIYGLGAGAVINWNPGKGAFSVRAVYLAADASNPNPNNQRLVGSVAPFATNNQGIVSGVAPFANLLFPKAGGSRGLFGDPYQGTVELEYAPAKIFALRLQYSGGKVFNGRFDVFGANFELALSKRLAIFGRYGYGSYNNTAYGDINPNYWMAGVAFPDLFVPSALGGIAVGQPFLERAVGNANQTNIEAFYNFPVSNNIRITPLVQVIKNPANQHANGTIVTGTLRMVFSF